MSLDILQTILAGDVQEEQCGRTNHPGEEMHIQHCGYLKGIKVLSLIMTILGKSILQKRFRGRRQA